MQLLTNKVAIHTDIFISDENLRRCNIFLQKWGQDRRMALSRQTGDVYSSSLLITPKPSPMAENHTIICKGQGYNCFVSIYMSKLLLGGSSKHNLSFLIIRLLVPTTYHI